MSRQHQRYIQSRRTGGQTFACASKPPVDPRISEAIRASPGVREHKTDAKGALFVSVQHHNGYMIYDYTLEPGGKLTVEWRGYQSPGGKKILAKDMETAVVTLAKAIKTQGKARATKSAKASTVATSEPGTATLPSDPKRKIYTGPAAIRVIRKHLKEFSNERFQKFIEKEDPDAGIVTTWSWIPDRGGMFQRSSAYQIAGGQYDKKVSYKNLSKWFPGSLEDMKKKAGVPLKKA